MCLDAFYIGSTYVNIFNWFICVLVMWCDVIWYDMIYDMIWFDMIWYDVKWHDMIWYDLILHTSLQWLEQSISLEFNPQNAQDVLCEDLGEISTAEWRPFVLASMCWNTSECIVALEQPFFQDLCMALTSNCAKIIPLYGYWFSTTLQFRKQWVSVWGNLINSNT